MRGFLIGLIVAALACALVAQLTPEKGKRSKEILNKARQLDLLNHILPLALSKEQYNKILPVIEKCRAKEMDIEAREADELRVLETKIDSALDKGVKAGLVPDKEVLREVNKTFIAFDMRRRAVADENTDAILAVLKSTLNAGQLKVAENTIDPKAFDPNAKPDAMSQDEKIKFFIKADMLDWSCYDLMVKLQKVAG